MSAISLPPVELLGAAAEEIASEAREAEQYATMRATDKALLQLVEGTSPVPVVGGWLLESRTRPGVVHRLSATHGCSCEAGLNDRICWHRQLMQIVARAAEQYTIEVPSKAEAQAQAEAELNDLISY